MGEHGRGLLRRDTIVFCGWEPCLKDSERCSLPRLGKTFPMQLHVAVCGVEGCSPPVLRPSEPTDAATQLIKMKERAQGWCKTRFPWRVAPGRLCPCPAGCSSRVLLRTALQDGKGAGKVWGHGEHGKWGEMVGSPCSAGGTRPALTHCAATASRRDENSLGFALGSSHCCSSISGLQMNSC